MGLSKKLGASSQKVCEPTSADVPYKWSKQTYTVAEILQKFKFPCVVQCATDSCTVVWSDFQFDLSQPLLLYSKRSAQKMHAVSIKQNNQVLEEIGPPLAIPEDYEGWFGAAPKGVSKAKRHFRIEGIANSTTPSFLVSTKCPAYACCVGGGDGNPSYVSRDIAPGEVLRKMPANEPNINHFDCTELIKLHGPCMECFDEKDERVIIPLSYAALSYEVAQSYPDDETGVFQISASISAGNSKLPRILTLVHGDPPLLAYAFTKMVRCYSVFTEETILAATLDDPNSRCLELATDSCVRFRLCLNEAVVKKTCEYTNAMQICENFGAKFLTGIKVSFSLKPEIPSQSDIDVSFLESVSDMQEVEANSEFEISWSSARKNKLFAASNSSLKDDSPYKTIVSCPEKTTVQQKVFAQIEDSTLHESSSDDQGDTNDSALPQHRDFTEQEIVDLMLRKGLMVQTEASKDPSLDMDVLKENRVTDNPLFYFFQRNPEQNIWKSEEQELELSEPDESQEQEINANNPTDEENPPFDLFKKNPAPFSHKREPKNPLSYLFDHETLAKEKAENKILLPEHVTNSVPSYHTITNSLPSQHITKSLPFQHLTDSSTTATVPSMPQHDQQSSYMETDISQYNEVTCKTAKSYVDEQDNGSSEDETIDSSDDDFSSECSEGYSDISDSPADTKDLSYHDKVCLPEKNVNPLCTDVLQNASNTPNARRANCLFKEAAETTQGKIVTEKKSCKSFDCNTITEKFDSDDMEAVDSLVSLVEVESKKDCTFDQHECPDLSEEHSTKNSSGREKHKTKLNETVHRVNNLLQEVSDLVSVSSCRILDSTKDNLQREDKKGATSNNTRHNVARNPPVRTIEIKQNGDFCQASVESGGNNSTSSLVPTGTTLFSNQQTEQAHDNRCQAKSTCRDTVNSNREHIKPTVDVMGSLRRSSVEADLTHMDEKTISKQPHTSVRTSVSSIFTSSLGLRNEPDTSNMNRNVLHRRDRESLDGVKNSRFHKTAGKYSSSNKKTNVFCQKDSDLMFLRNSDSLSSVSESASSSARSSYSEGTLSPKLVIIADNDLLIADRFNPDVFTTSLHRTEMSAVRQPHTGIHTYARTDHIYDDNPVNEQQYSVLNTKCGSITRRSHGGLFMIQNAGDGLREDYV